MKKSMLALAFASVFALFAQADEQAWFDAKINTYTSWPTNNESVFLGKWTNTENVELGGAASAANLVLDTDASTPLTFTANPGKTKTLGTEAKNITIESEVEFNPFDSGKMPEVPADAKAGLIVVTNTSENTLQYYVLAKDGSTNAWTAANGAATALNAEVSIAITNKGSSAYAAIYKVGDTVLTIGEDVSEIPVVLSSAEISGVAYSGSGVVKSLASTYRGSDVTINIPSVENATVAVTNGTTGVEIVSGNVTVPMGTSLTVVYTCESGYLFADGVKVQSKTYDNVNDDTEVDPDYDTASLAEARTDAKDYVTLAGAIAENKGTATVVYPVRNLGISAIAIDNNITIDLDGFAVTNVNGSVFTVSSGTVLIKNGAVESLDSAAISLTGGSLTIGDDTDAITVKGTTGVSVAGGSLTVVGGAVNDTTTIEGSTAAVNITAAGASFATTGKPTFRSTTAAIVSAKTGILAYGTYSPRFYTPEGSMSADLCASTTRYTAYTDGYYELEAKPTGYTVKFWVDEEAEEAFKTNNNVASGSTISAPTAGEIPAHEGTLDGWYYEVESELVKWDFANNKVTDNLDLIGVWNTTPPAPTVYTITLTKSTGVDSVKTGTVDVTSIELANGESATFVLGASELTVPLFKCAVGSAEAVNVSKSYTYTCTGAAVELTFSAVEAGGSGASEADVKSAIIANIDDGPNKDAAVAKVNAIAGTEAGQIAPSTMASWIKDKSINSGDLATNNYVKASCELGTELISESNKPEITDWNGSSTFKIVVGDGEDPVTAAAAIVQKYVKTATAVDQVTWDGATVSSVDKDGTITITKPGTTAGFVKCLIPTDNQ